MFCAHSKDKTIHLHKENQRKAVGNVPKLQQKPQVSSLALFVNKLLGTPAMFILGIHENTTNDVYQRNQPMFYVTMLKCNLRNVCM